MPSTYIAAGASAIAGSTKEHPINIKTATMLSHIRPVPEWYRAYYASINANPELLSVKGNQALLKVARATYTNGQAPSEEIYHVLITSSHLTKDPTQQVEKLRVIGTYDSLPLAKAAAHRAIFDAGYEAEFFKAYGVTVDFFDQQRVPRQDRDGLLVYAVAQDGTIFQVRIVTTPNDTKWTHQFENGRICRDLYYVVQTTASYYDDEGKSSRVHNIEGVFDSYKEARKLALDALLDEADGMTKESYAQYDEAVANETDCGYGENVLVHAVGQNGENLLVSVVKGRVLESVRLMEASMKIR